jgi:ATP-dependent Clp protease ATP-binding subunit ClpA
MAKEVGVPHAPDNNENDKNKKQTQQDDNQEKEVTALEYFSDNLNDLAMEGKLDPCIGREIELQRVIQIISRRKKNMQMSKSEYLMWKDYLNEEIKKKLDK